MGKRIRGLAALAAIAFVGGCGSAQGEGATAPPTAAPPATSAAAVSSAPPAATATATASAAAPAVTPESHVGGVSWAPSGDRLVAWCGSACEIAEGAPAPFHVADPLSGAVRTAAVPVKGSGPVGGVAFSAKGTYLLGVAGANVAVYRASDLSEVFSVEMFAVYETFAASPDETHLALVNASGFAKVFELAARKAVAETSLHDPNAGIDAAVAWPSSDRVVLGSDGHAPELWGIKGKRIAKLKVDGAGWGYWQMLVTPGGAVAVADGNGVVALFDGKDGKGTVLRRPAKQKGGSEGALTRAAIALSGDGKKLAAARETGDVTVFDLETKKAVDVLPAKEGASIQQVVISHDGARLAFGDLTSTHEVRAVSGATPEKLAGRVVGYSAEGVLVVQGDDFVAGLVEGKEKWRRPLTGAAVKAGLSWAVVPVFSPDGKVVAIPDGQLHLVRVADGQTVSLALEQKGGVRSLLPQGGATGAQVAAVLGK